MRRTLNVINDHRGEGREQKKNVRQKVEKDRSLSFTSIETGFVKQVERKVVDDGLTRNHPKLELGTTVTRSPLLSVL
jgi:hypothetical protein